MNDTDHKVVEENRRKAVKTATILGIFVAVFYIGFILSHL
jgi:hypothetical protein